MRGPGRPGHEEVRDLFQRRLCEPAIGGDLAAVNREQRRLAMGRVERQHVIAADVLGRLGAIAVQRPHARIGPDHVLGLDGLAKVGVRGPAQIGDLVGACGDRAGIAVVVLVGGADQGEIALVRNGENHAAVPALEDVGVVVPEQLWHDDVAALDEAHRDRGISPQDLLRHQCDPGTGGIDEDAGGHDLAAAAAGFERQPPDQPVAIGASKPRAGADERTALGGIDRVEHGEARIVDPAIGIFEAELVPAFERHGDFAVGEVEDLGAGEDLAPAEPVVEEQAGAQLPGRAQRVVMRQHEAQRPDQVRGVAQQHLALGERLVHEPQRALLEVAQAAVDQLGRGRGSRRGEIVLLEQQHPDAPPGRVTGDPRPVDAAADDGEVEIGHARSCLPAPDFSRGHLESISQHGAVCGRRSSGWADDLRGDHGQEARQAAVSCKIARIPTPTELVSGSKATIFCVSIRQNTSCSYLLRNFVIRLSIVPSHAALPGIPRCHGEETVP